MIIIIISVLCALIWLLRQTKGKNTKVRIPSLGMSEAQCGSKEKIHTSKRNKTVVMTRFIILLYLTEFDDRHLMIIYYHSWLPLCIKVWKMPFRSMISPYYEVLTHKCRHVSIIQAWFLSRFECSGQCFSMYGSQSKFGLQSCSEWVTKQFFESTYY